MSAHDIVVMGLARKSTWHHEVVRRVAAFDAEHGLGRPFVEGAMEPPNELDGRGFSQLPAGALPIDLSLNPYVRGGFPLQIASAAILVELFR
jgi:hypothetical protein